MNERIKLVEKILRQARKYGLNMDKVTEGKSIQTLAKNKTTIKNLEKRYARQKERPKILAEIESFKQEKLRKQRRKLITTESLADMKWGKNKMKPEDVTSKILKKETDRVSTEFLDRFFKQISFEAKAQRKIKKLKKRFGVRLDLAYELMDYIADYSFKYEIDRDIMREEMPEDFSTLLYDRLDEFDRILKREFKI